LIIPLLHYGNSEIFVPICDIGIIIPVFRDTKKFTKTVHSISVIQIKFEEINKRINDLQKQRYRDYQKWVLVKCNNAWKSFDNQKVFVDSQAKEMFEENEIVKIDQTLLTPEVSSVLNFVLGKILNGLPGAAIFDLESKMAHTPKRGLGDF